MVVQKFVLQLEAQLADRHVTIEATDDAVDWLAKNGFDELYGARPLARVIQENIKKPLADDILFGTPRPRAATSRWRSRTASSPSSSTPNPAPATHSPPAETKPAGTTQLRRRAGTGPGGLERGVCAAPSPFEHARYARPGRRAQSGRDPAGDRSSSERNSRAALPTNGSCIERLRSVRPGQRADHARSVMAISPPSAAPPFDAELRIAADLAPDAVEGALRRASLSTAKCNRSWKRKLRVSSSIASPLPSGRSRIRSVVRVIRSAGSATSARSERHAAILGRHGRRRHGGPAHASQRGMMWKCRWKTVWPAARR